MAEGGGTSGEKELLYGSYQSDFVFDFFCELCIDDGKHVEAEGFCVDCEEYLCGTCYNGHRMSRPSRHHVLLDKENMPKEIPLNTDRISKDISTKCKCKNGEVVKFYCKTHKLFGCATCFATVHKNCDETESILERSETILDGQEYKDFVIMLKYLEAKTRDIISQSIENKASTKRSCTQTALAVRKFKEEVIEILNEIEQTFIKKAEEIMTEDQDRTEKITRESTTILEKIQRLSADLAQLQTSKRVCQLYIKMHENTSELTVLGEVLQETEKNNTVSEYTFEPNDALKSYLGGHENFGNCRQMERTCHNQGTMSEETALGEALQEPETDDDVRDNTFEPHDEQISDGQDFGTVNCQTGTKQAYAVKTKVAHVADIDTSSTNDKSTHYVINGSTVYKKNRLVIVDRSFNYKISLFDTNTMREKIIMRLSSFPWDVAKAGYKSIAVTINDSNKIFLITVGDTFSIYRDIITGKGCRGVAYSRGRLFVTFAVNPRLEVMNLHGNVIRTIENGDDGDKLFSCPEYVCVSEDGATMYVSDYKRQQVIRLTMDGRVLFIYKDSDLKGPAGVCIDAYSNVYVCGEQSRNVHMITADCKKIKVILTSADGLCDKPRSISYCKRTNRLFIGMKNKTMNVFVLSR